MYSEKNRSEGVAVAADEKPVKATATIIVIKMICAIPDGFCMYFIYLSPFDAFCI